MEKILHPVNEKEDIFEEYRGTAIEDFLLFHNLGKDVSADKQPNLLVCTCMDFRISLNIPPRFAYILRIAGSNASYLEFQVAFAISVGDIKSIAIIGHDDCAMAGLSGKRQSFIDGMNKNAGWSKEEADAYFSNHCSDFEISDSLSFTICEVEKLRKFFPRICIAPLLYRIECEKLFQIKSF